MQNKDSAAREPIYGANKITQPSTAPPQPPSQAPSSRSKVCITNTFHLTFYQSGSLVTYLS